MPAKLFLTPKEVIARTGLPRDRVYGLLNAGVLKSIRMGSRFYVPLRALEEFMEMVARGELTHDPFKL